MASKKVEYWLTDDGLTLISGWARDGLIDKDIASKMDIAYSTFRVWRDKYPTISSALKKQKQIVDFEVENALLKKCFGYNAPVKKNLKLKRVEYKEGFKIKEYEEIVEVTDEVHIPADTTAQIFWLKNRQPDKWREKVDKTNNSDDDKVVIVNDLPK